MEIIKRIEKIKGIGNNRQLYNEQWQVTSELIKKWAKESGLDVREDCLGNIFCRLRGYDDSKTMAIISHFDSVENGGAYDGIVGILGGLEALKNLKDKVGIPEISIEVICIGEQEGTRFKTTFLGSRGINGMLNYEKLEKLVDKDKISFFEAREKAGFDSLTQQQLMQCQRNDIISCVELHVEQSPYLYKTGIPIGVVDYISGQMKISMTIIGEANHAGTTPMFERKDALCCAAKIISFVEHLGIKYEGITTTGYSVNTKNATNIIPSRVELIADMRHHNREVFNTMLADLYEYAEKEQGQRGVKIEIRKLVKIEPAQMSQRMNEKIKKSARQLDYKQMMLKSGAGHDVQIFSNAGIETGLIFIPSEEGISHRPEEKTKADDIIRGVKVLMHTIHELAY